MANEISVSVSLGYANTGITNKTLSSNFSPSITGKNYDLASFAVPTTAGGTAIPLGNLSNVGWGYFQNSDATNYVDIMTAASGTAFIRLLPGEATTFRFTPAITAPAALAHTATVLLQYLILEI